MLHFPTCQGHSKYECPSTVHHETDKACRTNGYWMLFYDWKLLSPPKFATSTNQMTLNIRNTSKYDGKPTWRTTCTNRQSSITLPRLNILQVLVSRGDFQLAIELPVHRKILSSALTFHDSCAWCVIVP